MRGNDRERAGERMTDRWTDRVIATSSNLPLRPPPPPPPVKSSFTQSPLGFPSPTLSFLLWSRSRFGSFECRSAPSSGTETLLPACRPALLVCDFPLRVSKCLLKKEKKKKKKKEKKKREEY